MALIISAEDPRSPRWGAKGSCGTPGALELAALAGDGGRVGGGVGRAEEGGDVDDGHLGETGSSDSGCLSQGDQAGRKAIRTRHINDMEVRN
jgi:hypothetical protein